MSGMANDAPTIPGRWATLHTCSSALSSRALTSNRLEANTTPSTSIPPRRGIRHRSWPSSSSSIAATYQPTATGPPLTSPPLHVHVDGRFVAPVDGCDGQLVQGHRLELRPGLHEPV